MLRREHLHEHVNVCGAPRDYVENGVTRGGDLYPRKSDPCSLEIAVTFQPLVTSCSFSDLF